MIKKIYLLMLKYLGIFSVAKLRRMATNLSLKNPYKFECKKCNYYTCSCKDYKKHLLTQKHIRNNLATFSNKIVPLKPLYACEKCYKEFKDRTGLWRHSKKCKETNIENLANNNNENNNHVLTDKDLMLMLINQNKELMEIVKNGTNHNTVNNNVNSHNKTFNLQVFLNETCKDAMNISDFIESVKLQVSDLENVGNVGYIEGISNIIIKNLKALDVNKRPVHCADQKREVMYVKEDNIWEKEDENNKKLRKAIRMIAHKNICMFKEFREKYPDCEEYDSKKNSQYNTIVYESMGGKGDNDYEKDTKIIKKIAKVVGIEKD